MSCHYLQQDGFALLTLDHPPVNSIDAATRNAVGAALDRAFADPAVQAVAITGGNGLFTGGA
ncbi:MAG TPA: enoyl-CoA hydratase-related protein, partial [Usitatibacteraceae bacterium]|nr:enoyl-CoA hydratase-related protein [Usitatibacteraceae bacterium]